MGTLKKASLWTIKAVAWLALTAGLWLGVFKLCSAHTDFPQQYHPDESSKTEQLLSNERNYYHPQLMLEGALLVMPPIQPNLDEQTVTTAARKVSGMFVASAVVLLAGAGAVAAGPFGCIAVAIATACCPALIEAGHYLKEDAALIFGMACVVCTGACFAGARRAISLIVLSLFLGTACGVAASGKYCGLVFLPLALVLVLVHLRSRPFWLGAIVFSLVVVTACASWAGINYRAIQHWDEFNAGIAKESEHITTGHSGVMVERPSLHFAYVVLDESVQPILALAILAPFAWLLQRRPSGFGPWLILMIAAYLGMLAYNAIPFVRYALPATVMTYTLGGLGLAWMARLDVFDRRIPWPTKFAPPNDDWRWFRRTLTRTVHAGFHTGRTIFPTIGTTIFVIGAITLAIVLGQRAADVNVQFAHDSRDALRDWVRTLPPNTRIVADGYTGLMGTNAPPELATPAHVLRRMWAAEFGSVQMLRQMGFDYVAISSASYERFFYPDTIGEPGDENWYVRRHTFYADLLANQTPVWQRLAAHPLHEFVNPDIRVYRIKVDPKIPNR